jgi:4-diphosphocytidyl-2-C-methyl-D-erythritol kinase
MSAPTRRAVFPALAKLNLTLKVLDKRLDGFHELRSIFQTISLADRIEVEYRPGRGAAQIWLESDLEIDDNLVTRAARLVMDATGAKGRLRLKLIKKIPMGAGMGGGSSDAAAVLLGLPALLGRRLEMERRIELGAKLGSDVPFFLLGGTALVMGRGTELYPMADARARAVVVVAPGVHVSTPAAYGALGRGLTTGSVSPIMDIFQSLAWSVWSRPGIREWSQSCENDFEGVVFREHPRLKSIKTQLRRSGARPALMTGSGSALFGVFETRQEAVRAAEGFTRERAEVVQFVSRGRYRSLWLRSLKEHVVEKEWPPQSRYAG